MEKLLIKNIDNEHFSKFWEIYDYSFPKNEKRTKENISKIINEDNFEIILYVDDSEVLGFFITWNFSKFLYIEYFATNALKRNQGLGKKLLRELITTTDKPIILEIDEIGDEISTRRYNFYSREGFVLNSYTHTPPAYDCKDKKLNLHIMSYPKSIDDDMYNEFARAVVEVVMSNIFN